MLNRSLLWAVVMGVPLGPTLAADVPGARLQSHQQLFAPTNPVGVASELPRSPLADLIVNGGIRFSDPTRAQARCPTDVVVWVAFGSNHYRPVGHEDPGALSGAYMCQADASSEGDRP